MGQNVMGKRQDVEQMEKVDLAIEVVVNGEVTAGRFATLSALIDALGYGEQRIATAVNGAFVAAGARDSYALRDGDAVEVVAPRQGG